MRLAWIVVTACRTVLGCVFVFSSIAKLVQPGEFYIAVTQYPFVGAATAHGVATVLPTLELMLGLMLLAGIAMDGSLLIAALLMMLFTGVHAAVWSQGIEITCSCFSVSGDGEVIGPLSIARNGALLMCAATGWIAARCCGAPSHCLPPASHGNDEKVEDVVMCASGALGE